MKTLKTFAEVEPYLPIVQCSADENRQALGFFTRAAFVEKACQNKLWVAVAEKTGEYLGYLLFGGVFPSLKVFQLSVSTSHRRQGIGEGLVEELVEFGEKENYLKISARVGADLDANKFWERVGFNLVRQEPGGKSSRRRINVRIRDLDTPSLLEGMGLATKAPSTKVSDLRFAGPISRSPIYVLDLNVFFDVIKCRVHGKEAAYLMRAGFNHQIRPKVTPEFTKELTRHTDATRKDPVLELARTLPTLPELDLAQVNPLLRDLQSIVFPIPSQTDKQAERIHSDLIHLVYCIHHRATGFVTRDKAILAAGDELRKQYDLEVIHPADLFEAYPPHTARGARVDAFHGEYKVSIEEAKEHERGEVEKFLETMGVDSEARAIVWDPGSSGSDRKRITIRNEEQLIGAASWDAASRFGGDVSLYFYLNEENPATDRVIDHVLETVFRDAEAFVSRRIFLYTAFEQARTVATARERGFVKSFVGEDRANPTKLVKFCFRGVVTRRIWSKFANDFVKATGLCLPETLPTAAEFINTGIPIKTPDSQSPVLLGLFDFETLTSPAIILCPGRTGLIVPIRALFAKQLFLGIDEQTNLFAAKEAILHIEKAYFRSPRDAKLFTKGLPIFFYQSGKESQEVIGCGRITYSEVLPVEKISVSVWRQGVLSDQQLKKIAGKSNNVHVLTFDNFNEFPKKIPYKFLRDNNLVSRANLAPPQRLRPEQVSLICRCGFGLQEMK